MRLSHAAIARSAIAAAWAPPSVIGIGGATLSFVLLAVALRHLPVGTRYAAWVGIVGLRLIEG